MTLLEMTRSRQGRPPRRPRRAGAHAKPARPPQGSPLAHVPVLAGELVELLAPRAGQTAIDCTLVDAGHARLTAKCRGPAGTLGAIDRDPLAQESFDRLSGEMACSARFLRMGYAEALALLASEGLQADIVYFDLGISSMQVDRRERGFSYSYDAPLDMRMDPDQQLSAREVVAEWDERRLARSLRELGEERHAGAIARSIVRRRSRAPIETTLQLVDAISSALPAPARFAGGHPAKRAFQALRIAVNDELGQLERGLPLAWQVLRNGGALAAISFHSLEDRTVKRFFSARARGCICPPELPVCTCGREPEARLLNRRAIVPSASEVQSNPRASSARLRGARKREAPSAEGGS